MKINYNSIADTQKLEVTNILSKIEAIDGALPDIQTTRAIVEIEYKNKEQTLKAEKNKLFGDVRLIRIAELTV